MVVVSAGYADAAAGSTVRRRRVAASAPPPNRNPRTPIAGAAMLRPFVPLSVAGGVAAGRAAAGAPAGAVAGVTVTCGAGSSAPAPPIQRTTLPFEYVWIA